MKKSQNKYIIMSNYIKIQNSGYEGMSGSFYIFIKF